MRLLQGSVQWHNVVGCALHAQRKVLDRVTANVSELLDYLTHCGLCSWCIGDRWADKECRYTMWWRTRWVLWSRLYPQQVWDVEERLLRLIQRGIHRALFAETFHAVCQAWTCLLEPTRGENIGDDDNSKTCLLEPTRGENIGDDDNSKTCQAADCIVRHQH